MNRILITLILIIILLVDDSQSIKKKFKPRYYSVDYHSELVYTSKGAIRGIVKETHQVFYGIPYARPPIGKLRWQNPVEPKYWKYIKNTNQLQPQCTQLCNSYSQIITSEDCLYLDVFRPRHANPTSKLPVLVYFPGGECERQELHDGSKFANSSVIFVTINYRLGVFGFLGTDILGGNYGILDQIKALEWINENIESFGGDKEKVTIWGSGNSFVPVHLVCPYSKPLFHAAILSSTPLVRVVLKDKSTARGYANRLIIKLGSTCHNIEDIDCLRSLSTHQLLEAQEKVQLQLLENSKLLETFSVWSPIVDGDIIPMQPLEAVRNGKIHNVPIVIGSVQDEATEFVYGSIGSEVLSLGLPVSTFKKRINPTYYSNYLSMIFPLTWKKVLARYPPTNQYDSRPILSRVINDYLFSCSNRYFINQFINQNDESSIFHYIFNHIESIDSLSSKITSECSIRSCHGIDIKLFIGSYELVNEFTDYDEVKISGYLLNYISNFAKTHNPNYSSSGDEVDTDEEIPITWRPITLINNSTLIIDNDFNLLDKTLINSKCDIFDQISYNKK